MKKTSRILILQKKLLLSVYLGIFGFAEIESDLQISNSGLKDGRFLKNMRCISMLKKIIFQSSFLDFRIYQVQIWKNNIKIKNGGLRIGQIQKNTQNFHTKKN